MPSRLEKLKEKQKQIQAQIRSLEAKRKSIERKQDTRKKILLGALLMEWMKKDDALTKKVMANLEKFLTRNLDRELFGLKVLEEKKDSKK